VVSVDPQEPLADDHPEPEEERQRGPARVPRQLLRQVDVRVLEHVRGVDPPLQPAVEPEPDHAPESGAILREELGQDLLVPVGGAPDQVIDVSGIGVHRKISRREDRATAS
jgi:hypothetical protein